jgi:hypothetical protein
MTQAVKYRSTRTVGVSVATSEENRDRWFTPGDRAHTPTLGAEVIMSTQPSDATKSTQSLELPVDELMRRGGPFPPHEEMIIEGLTDDGEEAFLRALPGT